MGDDPDGGNTGFSIIYFAFIDTVFNVMGGWGSVLLFFVSCPGRPKGRKGQGEMF